MIAELGLFCLLFAFVAAMMQSALPWAVSNPILRGRLMLSSARWQAVMVSLSFAILIALRLMDDFSVANVTANSSRALPVLYKITGSWGNHEGSMMLWLWVLAVAGLLMTLGVNRLKNEKALAVQGALAAGILLFVIATSNPFARIFPPPRDGNDLNALLQDIGLAMHPPLLYLGYVGFSAVFSLAVAGLVQGRIDREWAQRAHPWIMAAWSFLTLGIGLGSWWAYRELGWGGWWFWDPVENASLLPWLSGTALLHSNIVLMRRGQLAHWVMLLAIITFLLSLTGTFLVRSGVVTSVHSFASDPARGTFILIYIALAGGLSLGYYALRPPATEETTPPALLSRETGMIVQNILLLSLCGVVALGTLYPIVAEWMGGERISVGTPYFNATFMPLAALAVIAAGIVPHMAWKKARAVMSRKGLVMLGLTVTGGIWAFMFAHGAQLIERLVFVAGMAFAAWLGASTLIALQERVKIGSGSLQGSWQRFCQLNASFHAMWIAHGAVAIFVAGVTATGMQGQHVEAAMEKGETLALGRFSVRLDEVEFRKGPNFTARATQMKLFENGDALATLTPQLRNYGRSGMQTSEAALYATAFYDMYAVVGGQTEEGKTGTRLYYMPLIGFVWGGFLLAGLGGLVGCFAGRRTKTASL